MWQLKEVGVLRGGAELPKELNGMTPPINPSREIEEPRRPEA